MEKFNVPVILGTAREGRQSEKVAKFIFNEVSTNVLIEPIFIDVRDYIFGHTRPAWVEDSETIKWKKIAKEADGYIIIIPEYNHGYPGELKLLLDSAFKEYSNKPAVIAGVSKGGFGGARVVDHIKPVLIEMGMIPLGKALYFSRVEEAFSDDGTPTDNKLKEFLTATMDVFVKYMRATREIRK